MGIYGCRRHTVVIHGLYSPIYLGSLIKLGLTGICIVIWEVIPKVYKYSVFWSPTCQDEERDTLHGNGEREGWGWAMVCCMLGQKKGKTQWLVPRTSDLRDLYHVDFFF